ncbi:MAG: hypothetical protein II707_05550, partial [Spirochaetales bacterium]|nr:hypothetical protein [Spirochaetales bacterium]
LTKCKNYKFDDGCLTQLKKIIVDSDKKEFIGEMNNFYVALTRPAMNLVVYNIIDSSVEYKKECEKIGVDKDGHPESLLKDKNIVLALYKKYIPADIDNAQKDKIYERYIDEDHRVYSFCDGQWELVPPKKKSDDNQKVSQNFIFDKMGEYIRYDLWQPDIESARAAKLNDKEFDENIENAKTSFGERKRLFGIAVHYYMSKIIYADKEEKRLAHRALYMKYGNILDNEAIDKAACVADKFISKFAYLFDRNKWNRVLNEQWLIAADGSLRRLDRIMFNTDTHEILIADYKTGKEDKEQLKEYTELVKDKVGNGWRIDAKNFFL